MIIMINADYNDNDDYDDDDDTTTNNSLLAAESTVSSILGSFKHPMA